MIKNCKLMQKVQMDGGYNSEDNIMYNSDSSNSSKDIYVPLVERKQRITFPCYFCPDKAFPTESDVHCHNLQKHRKICSNYSFTRRRCKKCNFFTRSLSFRGLISHIVENKCRSQKVQKRRSQNSKLNFPNALRLQPITESTINNQKSAKINNIEQKSSTQNKIESKRRQSNHFRTCRATKTGKFSTNSTVYCDSKENAENKNNDGNKFVLKIQRAFWDKIKDQNKNV